MKTEDWTSLPKGRTIPINGDAVRTLRIGRRWGVADLARKTGCSAKNIEKIEKGGKRVFAATLIDLCDALQVDAGQLVEVPAESPATPPGEPQERRVSGMSVHFTFNFENVQTTDQLFDIVEKLRATIGATADIRVLTVEEGSVILTLDMSEDDALKLASAMGEFTPKYGVTKLDELSVSEVSLPPNPAMLRVKEMFRNVHSSDLDSTEYEKSHLHGLGLKNIWYLIHIADALNERSKALMPERWEALYTHLLAEAAAEGMEPTSDEIFAARLLVRWLPQHPISLLPPEFDSSGSVRIARLHPGQRSANQEHDESVPTHGDAGTARNPEEAPADQIYTSEDDSDDTW